MQINSQVAGPDRCTLVLTCSGLGRPVNKTGTYIHQCTGHRGGHLCLQLGVLSERNHRQRAHRLAVCGEGRIDCVDQQKRSARKRAAGARISLMLLALAGNRSRPTGATPPVKLHIKRATSSYLERRKRNSSTLARPSMTLNKKDCPRSPLQDRRDDSRPEYQHTHMTGAPSALVGA